MKTKLPLIAALCCGLSSVGSAFTLDFQSATTGTMLPPSLQINVPGYGLVQFDPVAGSTLVVDDRYENDSPGTTTSPSLNFDNGDSVKVTFLAAQPLDVTFASVGENIGEQFNRAQGSTLNEFIVTLNGTPSNPLVAGAGIYEIGFTTAVPEPSSALLGLIGTSLLVFRRRR